MCPSMALTKLRGVLVCEVTRYLLSTLDVDGLGLNFPKSEVRAPGEL